MTLCIALECLDNGEPAIVLCADQKVGNYYSSSETHSKVYSIGHGWYVMLAGTVVRAENLIRRFVDHFGSLEPDSVVSEDDFLGPVEEYRRYIAEEHCSFRYGFSFDNLPDWLRLQAAQSIPTTDVQLIFASFHSGESVIASVCDDDPPSIQIHRDFSVIGSGSVIATSSLHQREYTRDCDLQRAVYLAYEAKRTGEMSEGVGPNTSVFVLRKDKVLETLTDASIEGLDKLYEKTRPAYWEDKLLKKCPVLKWESPDSQPTKSGKSTLPMTTDADLSQLPSRE